MVTAQNARSERRLSAIAVSRGIGIGNVVFFQPDTRHLRRLDVGDDQIDVEFQRLHRALDLVREKTHELALKQGSSGIFTSHLLVFEQGAPFVTSVESTIRDRRVNAEWAVKLVAEHQRKRQASVTDPQFQERSADIADIADRLLDELAGESSDDRQIPPEAIVVARELRPSQIVTIGKNRPAAIITELGGWTSHSSILAREMSLPMVSGTRDATSIFDEGDNVIVDAINGEIVIDPDLDTIERYRTINLERDAGEAAVIQVRRGCFTRDGTDVRILANVENANAYEFAKKTGAAGIGLFRSESLIEQPGRIPNEDDQTAAYLAIAKAVGDEGVRIRTFDIGPEQFSLNSASRERNPSLGQRSIRLSLSEPEYFRTQIRALLRASAEGQIDITLPMVNGVAEILRTKAIIDEELDRLNSQEVLTGDPNVGAMIEVPSAVLTAEDIARNVDYLCLGTNDLVQYLLAVDRDNDAVSDWYQTLHPSVFRAIRQVITAADDAGIPAIVCGEMAGSPFYVPLLLGCGARDLSMNPNSITHVRRLIAGITIDDAAHLTDRAMACSTAAEAEAVIRMHYVENWADLFPSGLLLADHR